MERIVSKAVGETKRINRKVVAVILMAAMVASLCLSTKIGPFSKAEPSNGRAITVEDVEEYRFAYFSEKETNAFFGFLLNLNEVSEEYHHTGGYEFLTGKYRGDKEKEELARLALFAFSEYCINSNIDDVSAQMNEAGNAVCGFLEKKYGTNAENELTNELINEELSTFKDIILELVAIATDTDMVKIEAVCETVGLVKDVYEFIKDPNAKVQEYFEKIEAVMNACKLFSAASHLDMYRQFSLYVKNATLYLNCGSDYITNAYCDMNQEMLTLGNELAHLAEFLESLPVVNNYCLNWTTEQRVKLLKKWAITLAYCKYAASSDVTTQFCDYDTVNSEITTQSGKTYSFTERIYRDKYSLRKRIKTEDLDYSVKNGEVWINKLSAYDGKYYDVEIPKSISGYPVTTIKARAFENTSVSSVVIPQTVSTIEENAFKDTILSYIVVMGKDVSISPSAFSWTLDAGDISHHDVDTPIYAPIDSDAKEFAESEQGFYYQQLAWDGTTKWGVDFQDNVFHVWTANDLAFVQELVSLGYSLKGKTIKIMADLDLGNQKWVPIGEDVSKPFCGSLKADGYEVSNLLTSPSPKMQCAGLFGFVNAEDTSFSDIRITGSSNGYYSGALIGTINVLKGSVVLNNVISDTAVSSNGSSGAAGGIVGQAKLSEEADLFLNQCASLGSITGQGGAGYSGTFVGGIIGYVEKGDVTVSECASRGEIKGLAYSPNVGGIIGRANTHSLVLSDVECFAYIDSRSTNGDAMLGGVVGSWNNSYLDDSSRWLIRNSYTSSVLDGAYTQGAFVAIFENGGTSIKPIVVENCYFDISKNPNLPSDRLKAWCALYAGRHSVMDNVVDSGGYTTNELIDNKALYSNWDFENIWEYAPSGLPKLKWIDIIACNSHFYDLSITDPSCTAKGYTTYTCRNCHYHYNSNYVDATGHSYAFSRTVIPTCTAQGYDLYTCAVCGVTEKRNTKSATGHAVLSYDRVVPPTCVAQGYSEGSCSKCGQTIKENYVEPVGHDYAVTHTQNASCTETGIDTYTCKNCGDSYTKDIVALGHSFAWADNIHIAPSCTEEGYTVETCSRCGETQRTNTLPATGHDFGDIISYDHVSNIYDENKRFVDSLAYTPNTVTANTIGSTAIGSSELLRAGWAVAPREIRLDSDKLGAIEEYAVTLTRHPLSLTGVANVSSVFAYDDTTQRSPEESALPYTDSEGNLYSIDSGVLSLAMNREQAEQKGILNPDGTVNVLAAEAENLKLAYSAGIPGTYILLPNIEFQNALTGWNEPVSIFHYDGKGAAEPGVRHVNYCFYNETLSGTLETTIKLYDYSKQNQLVPSTSDMPSYIKHTCVDCGSVVKEDIQSDQKLKIKAVSLSLGNNLSMNFKVDKTILDDYSDLCIEIMRNGKVTKVSSYKVQGDDIVFSFDGIAPQTMNDNTSAVLYGATPSKLYRGESVSTSVKEYASKALELYNDNKYAKLRTLMVDLLNYGSTAQIYHNYQKASLANADLTEEQQAWASIQPLELENITNTEYQTVSNPIANWKSASLILDNAVAIRYKFECEDVSGMVVKVQYGDIEKVFDGTSFEESGTGEYSFKFSGLYAHQMRLPIYVTLYKDDKPVSNTLQYSVESYAAQVAEIMPKSSLNTLTDSMMRYGISAFEYGN